MDARLGFVFGRAASAFSDMITASRADALVPVTPSFWTAAHCGLRGPTRPLGIRRTGMSQRRMPRAHTRFADHRSGLRPANRLTFGFSSLHLVGLRRRMEGL